MVKQLNKETADVQKERETERQRETDRETERQRDRETERQRHYRIREASTCSLQKRFRK